MTKSALSLRIYRNQKKLRRQIVEDAVSLFFNEITSALQRGQRVELRGLGSFSLRRRPCRLAHNPKTGVTKNVDEKTMPFFKASKQLQELINLPPSSAWERVRKGRERRLLLVHSQPDGFVSETTLERPEIQRAGPQKTVDPPQCEKW